MTDNIYIQTENNDKLKEECGVFGVYDFDGHDVASTIYYGLLALQHRGQESCGIAVSDTNGPKGKVLSSKDMGLVNEAFTPEHLEKLKGDIGVGHVRYSTAGGSTRENAQPLVLNYVKGTLGLAHNGNLINAPELRRELEYTGAIFQTTIDSEVIAYHIARERLNSKSVEEAVGRAMTKIKGAYSLVVMSPRKLIGARDPYGFKPLCIGKRDHSYFLSSETCALDTVGAEFVRDVLPGEIVTISPEKGIESDTSHVLKPADTARCIFEYIYFARPDSFIDGDQRVRFPYSGRKVPGYGFPGGCGSGHRRTGIRQLRCHGIFHAVRNPLWYGLREKCLCGQNFHQAEAEEQREQCTGQIKSYPGSRGRQACHHDR